MPRSILVDTNILIDAAVPGREQHVFASMLEDEAAYGGLKVYVAATSLKDAYFLIKSETDEAFAREYIQCLLRLYSPVAVDAFVCEEAAYSDEPDFEDGIIRACAETARVAYIVSRDEKAFKRSAIKRISAQEYIETIVKHETIDLPASPGEHE